MWKKPHIWLLYRVYFTDQGPLLPLLYKVKSSVFLSTWFWWSYLRDDVKVVSLFRQIFALTIIIPCLPFTKHDWSVSGAGTCGRLLSVWYWSFGFHKMIEIPWLPEELSFSRKSLLHGVGWSVVGLAGRLVVDKTQHLPSVIFSLFK